MKKVNGYWVDENSNKWNSDYITEEQAEIFSKSLIDCYDCSDCINCSDCISCRDCRSCRDCSYCIDCRDCRSCCYCSDCRDCSDCSYCRYCRYCVSYSYCHDYIENPLRYVTEKIGSRDDNTTFYYGKTKNGMSLQVVCGCFRGNLKEFEQAVLKTHKNNSVFRNEYLKEIEKVKVLFDLGKKEEVER